MLCKGEGQKQGGDFVLSVLIIASAQLLVSRASVYFVGIVGCFFHLGNSRFHHWYWLWDPH